MYKCHLTTSIVSAGFLILSAIMVSAQVPFKIVSTSQTKFYNDSVEIPAPSQGQPFYGQDAQYSGNIPGYHDNYNGTVNDLLTGLTWQRDYDQQPHRWEYAQTLLANINNQQLGGYSDWRIPNIKELYSLWNSSKGWPYIDTINFPISQVQIGHAIFWSCSEYSGTMGNVVPGTPGDTLGAPMIFGVNFGTGHIKGYSILPGGPPHFFRFVRGSVNYGINQFQDNGDGTISDLATGLMWQKDDSHTGMDWKDALAYVQTNNAANFLGHDDWRLPNTKQLQSIVDYSRSPAATDSTERGPAIDTIFNCTGIINEAGNPDFPWYWTGTSARFDLESKFECAWYVAFGRAVEANGEDKHGAGAVRFDKKALGTLIGEDAERVINFVRLVRLIDVTGINEQDKNSGRLNIYPNPVNNILTVETISLTTDGLISVYNFQGQLVLQAPFIQSKTEMNVEVLANGIYVLKVEKGNCIIVSKLIKE